MSYDSAATEKEQFKGINQCLVLQCDIHAHSECTGLAPLAVTELIMNSSANP